MYAGSMVFGGAPGGYLKGEVERGCEKRGSTAVLKHGELEKQSWSLVFCLLVSLVL